MTSEPQLWISTIVHSSQMRLALSLIHSEILVFRQESTCRLLLEPSLAKGRSEIHSGFDKNYLKRAQNSNLVTKWGKMRKRALMPTEVLQSA